MAQIYQDFTNTDRIPKVTERLKQDIVTNLPQGVVFKKTGLLDLSSSTWPHIFRIPHLPKLPPLPSYQICDTIPVHVFGDLAYRLTVTNTTDPDPAEVRRARRVSRRVERKIQQFCQHYIKLEANYKLLMDQTEQEINRQYTLMHDLILPNKKVEPVLSMELLPADTPEQYQHLHDTTTTTQPPLPKEVRQKRHVFSFLGETTGHWFGLANTKDLHKLWTAIDYLQENAVELTEHFNKFTDRMLSISKLEKERVDNISRTLTQALLGLKSIQVQVEDINIAIALNDSYDIMISEIFIEAFQVISMLQDATHNYLEMIQERCVSLISLNNHLLPPSLVPPAELNRTLLDIEQVLLRDYAPFRFAMTTLDYFYSVPSTSYLADDQFLYVEIQIPLTILSSYYQVYEVHSVPMAVGTGDTQYTQLKDLPKYVAYSAQGDTYAFLDEKFISSCEGTGIQRCHQRKMESSTLVPSCVLGLFIDDPNMIRTHCKADFILTPPLPESAIDIGHGNFFVNSMNTSAHWTISCNDRKPRALASCRSCVIALDCRCNLKTPNSFISASIDNCPEATSSSGLTKTYVPNFTWMQSLSPDPLNYTYYLNLQDTNPNDYMPEHPIPTYQDIAQYVDSDKEVRTALDQVTTQVERQSPIYMSKFQKLSEEAQYLTFGMNHAIPLALAGLAWDAVLTAILIIMCRQQGGTAMFLGKLSGAVAANPLPSPPTTSTLLSQKYCLWYVAILLSTYVICVLIWKFVRHRRQKQIVGSKHYPTKTHEPLATEIFLKLWTPFRLAILQVDNILAPQHDLEFIKDVQFPTPNYHDRDIYFSYHPMLRGGTILVNWHTYVVRHKVLNVKIPLNSNIPVPRSVRHTVLEMFKKNNFKASLIFKIGPSEKDIPLVISSEKLGSRPTPVVPRYNPFRKNRSRPPSRPLSSNNWTRMTKPPPLPPKNPPLQKWPSSPNLDKSLLDKPLEKPLTPPVTKTKGDSTPDMYNDFELAGISDILRNPVLDCNCKYCVRLRRKENEPIPSKTDNKTNTLDSRIKTWPPTVNDPSIRSKPPKLERSYSTIESTYITPFETIDKSPRTRRNKKGKAPRKPKRRNVHFNAGPKSKQARTTLFPNATTSLDQLD